MRAFVVSCLLVLGRSAGASPTSCGQRPPTVEWFYLGEPLPAYADPAGKALDAITRGFDKELLPRDPRCLRITVLDVDALHSRSKSLDKRDKSSSGMVGFHDPKLGVDDMVFVTPSRQIVLEVVMTHEVLHALSHRFTKEAQRARLVHMVEGATQYITEQLAAFAMDRHNEHSAYDDYVRFFTALMKKLGDEGPRLLADSYLRDGWASFEQTVDRRLGVSLGVAARALEHDDLAGALAEIGASAPRGR